MNEDQQLDVYEKEVDWSTTKQLRSVLDTELSVDDLFDYMVDEWTQATPFAKLVKGGVHEHAAKHAASAKVEEAMGFKVFPLLRIEKDAVLVIHYRVTPLPWYVLPQSQRRRRARLLHCSLALLSRSSSHAFPTDSSTSKPFPADSSIPIIIRPISARDFFIVQHYVREKDGAGVPSFFTYNHNLQHPYFAPRDGFVRGGMKFQGLVGRTVGATTRLTWLVNVDFAGFIPAAFSAAALVGLCAYPVDIVERTRDFVEQRRGSSSTAASLGFGLEDGDVGGGDEGAQDGKRAAALTSSALLEANAELKAQSKRDALKIAALETEVSTLRQRLARRDGSDHEDVAKSEGGGKSGESGAA